MHVKNGSNDLQNNHKSAASAGCPPPQPVVLGLSLQRRFWHPGIVRHCRRRRRGAGWLQQRQCQATGCQFCEPATLLLHAWHAEKQRSRGSRDACSDLRRRRQARPQPVLQLQPPVLPQPGWTNHLSPQRPRGPRRRMHAVVQGALLSKVHRCPRIRCREGDDDFGEQRRKSARDGTTAPRFPLNN